MSVTIKGIEVIAEVTGEPPLGGTYSRRFRPARIEVKLYSGLKPNVAVFGPNIKKDGEEGKLHSSINYGLWGYPLKSAPKWVIDFVDRVLKMERSDVEH